MTRAGLVRGLGAGMLVVGALAASVPLARLLQAQGIGITREARIALPEARGFDAPPVAGPADPTLPLVVLDAGHGGFDYGARAPGFDEKALVLGIVLALRDRLVSDGNVRVALTRADDRFVSLGERYELARRLGADLFLSIHADSSAESGERAQLAHGASVYTLSQVASDNAAQRFAARENVAGGINGQQLAAAGSEVSAILVDLSQRRTQVHSERFAEIVEQTAAGRIPLRSPARQSAALEVLRAPDVPSALFESGYITNPRDAARLASAEGRSEIANVLSRAIRLFFAARRIEDAASEEAASPSQSSSPIASSSTAP